MKQGNKIVYIVLFILFGIFEFTHADENWIVEGKLETMYSGTAETVLPPELHMMADRGAGYVKELKSLDIELLGPDMKPRSFELFWKEKSGSMTVQIRSEKVTLDDDLGMVWEGSIRHDFRADHLRIIIADQQGMGKVDVEGYIEERWQVLAKNAAIYRTGSHTLADINIEPGDYKKFRFRFFGYDVRWRYTPLPIEKIVVSGKRPGRGYVFESFVPEFISDTHDVNDRVKEIKAALPGSGIYISRIEVLTEAQFQGTWTIGKEVIAEGRKKFQQISRGNIYAIKKDEKKLIITINRVWEGRSLIIRLNTQGRFIGKTESLMIKARLPRLVFFADQPGVYSARTGTGAAVRILKIAGDQKRYIGQILKFSKIKQNTNWQPVDFVKKFGVLGGPFNIDGYSWRSGVHVPGPGLYRIVFTSQANMEKNQTGIRLVRGNKQVPFFDTGNVIQTLNLSIDPDYNQEKNSTSWFLQLPYTSMRWDSIKIRAEGIFERDVKFEKHKHGQMGWEHWMTRHWVNRNRDETVLTIDMRSFPNVQEELRVSMDHKDNKPLVLKRIEVMYRARAIVFLAAEAGQYELVGGHPDANRPVYDLSLVQDYLLSMEPVDLKMGEITVFKGKGLQTRLTRVFSSQGWGLYIVLGLVTIILLFIIVRLFPKEQ